jgi:hypothetical protein
MKNLESEAKETGILDCRNVKMLAGKVRAAVLAVPYGVWDCYSFKRLLNRYGIDNDWIEPITYREFIGKHYRMIRRESS